MAQQKIFSNNEHRRIELSIEISALQDWFMQDGNWAEYKVRKEKSLSLERAIRRFNRIYIKTRGKKSEKHLRFSQHTPSSSSVARLMQTKMREQIE